MIYIGLIVLLLIIFYCVNKWLTAEKKLKSEQKEPSSKETMPYTSAKLLTRREYAFFKSLQPIAQKHNLMICPKIRLADLVAVPQGTKDIKWFNYIKAKHVDFTLCDMDLRVKLVIELDDTTHDRPDRQTRDDFVDRVFKQINIKLLHIRQWGDDLESIIVATLHPVEPVPAAPVSATVPDSGTNS